LGNSALGFLLARVFAGMISIGPEQATACGRSKKLLGARELTFQPKAPTLSSIKKHFQSIHTADLDSVCHIRWRILFLFSSLGFMDVRKVLREAVSFPFLSQIDILHVRTSLLLLNPNPF
jgi:hypothetical protein